MAEKAERYELIQVSERCFYINCPAKIGVYLANANHIGGNRYFQGQYALVGSTIRSYLSWLKDTGKVTAAFQDSMLLWQKI